jgi:tripartite-type tricarboxylate transporter receptor subunit TctC
VPLALGGAVDLFARKLAEHMRASLGQPIVIESVSGAGGLRASVSSLTRQSKSLARIGKTQSISIKSIG